MELFKHYNRKEKMIEVGLDSPFEKLPHSGDLLFLLHCGARIKWQTLAGREYISFTY
jgi:hypothetical protein